MIRGFLDTEHLQLWREVIDKVRPPLRPAESSFRPCPRLARSPLALLLPMLRLWPTAATTASTTALRTTPTRTRTTTATYDPLARLLPPLPSSCDRPQIAEANPPSSFLSAADLPPCRFSRSASTCGAHRPRRRSFSSSRHRKLARWLAPWRALTARACGTTRLCQWRGAGAWVTSSGRPQPPRPFPKHPLPGPFSFLSLRYKEAFANATSWHVDMPYWSFFSPHALSQWIALDDATKDNGCMYFHPSTCR